MKVTGFSLFNKLRNIANRPTQASCVIFADRREFLSRRAGKSRSVMWVFHGVRSSVG